VGCLGLGVGVKTSLVTDTENETDLTVGMLIFENFISQYENFKSRDSSSTRKLTRHSDVDDALNA